MVRWEAKMVLNILVAEGTAIAAYFLGPWLWIPSIANDSLLSTVLTTLVVVMMLIIANPATYGIRIGRPVGPRFPQ